MHYLDEEKLKLTIHNYFVETTSNPNETCYLDDTQDRYEMINDILDTDGIWQNGFEFHPYLVDCGTNYIYIMGLRQSDLLEFIVDNDFWIIEQDVTEDMVLSYIKGLDQDMYDKVQLYNLNNN